jgi:hypothetical protein
MMIFGYLGLAITPLLVAGFVYVVLGSFGATGWDLKVPPAVVAIVLSWAMYGTVGWVVSAALFALMAAVELTNQQG